MFAKRKKRVNSPATALSKRLSWALRHGADELGLHITSDGFIQIDELLRSAPFRRTSFEEIHAVVHRGSFRRFTLAETEGVWRIRSNLCHTLQSVDTAQLFKTIDNPRMFEHVYYATQEKWLPVTLQRGAYCSKRTYIPLCTCIPSDGMVTPRIHCDVFIEIDMPAAMEDEVQFYVNDCGSVESPGIHGFISPKYFKRLVVKGVDMPLPRNTLETDYFFVVDGPFVCIVNTASKRIERSFPRHNTEASFKEFLVTSGFAHANWIGVRHSADSYQIEWLDRWVNFQDLVPPHLEEKFAVDPSLRGLDRAEAIAQLLIQFLQAEVWPTNADVNGVFRREVSEIGLSPFKALLIVHFDTVKTDDGSESIVAGCFCMFDLQTGTASAYQKKLIKTTARFDVEHSLVLTEQIYTDWAISFAEFADSIGELLTSTEQCALALLSDFPSTADFPQPVAPVFRSWVNLYKYFTNSNADSPDNLQSLYRFIQRDLPKQSSAESQAEHALRAVTHYMTALLGSRPRQFESEDLSYYK